MKYRINDDQDRIVIQVGELGDDQGQILDAFQACQEGRCTCPTDEYKKLESLEIQPGEDSVTLELTPRQGLQLDPGEIERCLDHTREQIEGLD
jgi:hypothetical protein